MSTTTSSGTDLCVHCSQIPWDDFLAMSKIERFYIRSISDDPLCPICRMYLTIFRHMIKIAKQVLPQNTDGHVSSKATIETPHLRFRAKGATENSFYICSQTPSFVKDFTWPRLLVSSVDHEQTVARLQQIFPTDANLQLVKNWLQDCETYHNDCLLHRRIQIHNFRVIDCEQMKVVEAPPECRFIALSYVWGDSAASASDDLNDIETLPTMIQQCIRLTIYLDFRYLWIDRYCIHQIDPKARDEQISQMGDIYAAACLTIIAAAGTSPCYGLPGVQPTPRKPPDHVPVGSVRVYALPKIKEHIDAFATSKWASRAWTFQEGFFSRRRLIFTERQMMFVCNTSTCYKALTLPLLDGCGDSTLAHVIPRDRVKSDSGLDNPFMGRAREYIQSYSGRALQFDGDALNAIKGALNTLAGERIHHICGVPFHFPWPEKPTSHDERNRDLRGEIPLSWQSLHNMEDLYVYRPRGYPRRRMEFPSWSPIGWDCSISFHKPIETAGISLQTEFGKTDLRKIVPSSGLVATTLPQQLLLELPAATFTIVTRTKGATGEVERRVALQYQDSTYMCFDTNWDVPFDKLQNAEFIKGVLLRLAPQAKSKYIPGSAYALLIQPHGDHYERVGVARLVLQLRKKRTNTEGEAKKKSKSKPREEYMHRDNACIRQSDRDVEQTDWWLRHFVKETIILV